MASQTRPFALTGVALASAAAIVAATPHAMPALTAPTPTALLQAEVELTDFAAFLTVGLNPANILQAGFAGWRPGDPAVNPENGTTGGVSSIIYLLADSLINGRVGVDPDAWGKSAVNAFFEGGLTGGYTYVINRTLSNAPEVRGAVDVLLTGPQLVTLAFNTVLGIAAGLVSVIPVIGPVIANGINAYLGGWDAANGVPCSAASNTCSSNSVSGVLDFALWQIGQLTGEVARSLTPAASAEPAPAALGVVEDAVPVADVPVADVPVADVPVADVPAADVPVADVPVADVPVADVPAADVPVADVPVADVPAADVPAADVPAADVPVAEVIPAEEATDEPAAEAVDPALDAVIEDLEVAAADVAEEAVAGEPASQDPAADDAAPAADDTAPAADDTAGAEDGGEAA
jgi:hypothetical protein